jgi:hypothetical protein
MPIQSSPAHITAAHPGTAKTSNPHRQWAAHREFVPRGLSDAKRHPKLFTRTEGRVGSDRKRLETFDSQERNGKLRSWTAICSICGPKISRFGNVSDLGASRFVPASGEPSSCGPPGMKCDRSIQMTVFRHGYMESRIAATRSTPSAWFKRLGDAKCGIRLAACRKHDETHV